ncbi:peptide methionine sulfoxide reductase MsrB [Striga asiatica]|uniref:Peptide methionine sulfoxide reductase MsrB n=1 Tax=Striga asiatica TaxID=4170 RepID=A0A5A7PWC2_STRAF|nr:peptide methionine sulfoxide reductase MsrB [Striga asiatica]
MKRLTCSQTIDTKRQRPETMEHTQKSTTQDTCSTFRKPIGNQIIGNTTQMHSVIQQTHRSTTQEYWDIGDASFRCFHCGAKFLYSERLGQPSKPKVPKRGSDRNNLDEDVVRGLNELLHHYNVLVKSFRMARETNWF